MLGASSGGHSATAVRVADTTGNATDERVTVDQSCFHGKVGLSDPFETVATGAWIQT
jgi:hypothetical protein